MTFMWRLYIPMTNRFRLARIFTSHWPLDGNCMGVDGVKRGRLDRTLTKRTTPGRTDCLSKGFFDVRFAISRPWQTTISATNGSWRATSARAWAWVIGCRMTSVPAAPMLTAPTCFNASASLVGRKVRWPPTLTPLTKTTSATRFPLNESARNVIFYRGGRMSGSGQSTRCGDPPILAASRRRRRATCAQSNHLPFGAVSRESDLWWHSDRNVIERRPLARHKAIRCAGTPPRAF
jgi:hypothetical protein